MDLRKQGPAAACESKVSAASIFVLLALIFVAANLGAGCAAPGQPMAQQSAVPAAITDLTAKQLGSQVALTFTLPKETVQGRPLAKPPQIEIYREFVQPHPENQTGQPAPPRSLTFTVPSQMVEQYRLGQQIRFPDVLAPSDISAHAGSNAVYMVRTRISKHDSADSNIVAVGILPPPQPIQDLQARITKSAIELYWTPAEILSTEGPQPISIRYRVYRSHEGSNSAASASGAPSPASATSPPFSVLAETASPSYSDINFKFGETYAYRVSAIAQYESASIESEYSKIAEVTPRDTFPPAPPSGLVAAAFPPSASMPVHVDLSWAISSETDVAGYNVYRNNTETGLENRWNILNNGLLLTPSFRDISAISGQRYFYRVTAVDRFGNESAPSDAVDVSVPATND